MINGEFRFSHPFADEKRKTNLKHIFHICSLFNTSTRERHLQIDSDHTIKDEKEMQMQIWKE